MKKFKDAMIDVETLGVEGLFVVTQISIVPFDVNSGVVCSREDSFSVNLSLKDCLNNGLSLNTETLMWWLKTNPDMLSCTISDGHLIKDAMVAITNYISKLEVDRFWATATLDYQAISNLSSLVEVVNPIPYNKRFCARTVRELFLSKTGTTYKNDNNHDSYSDCVSQIHLLCNQLKGLL